MAEDELKQLLVTLHAETREHIDATAKDLNHQFNTAVDEVAGRFNVLGESIANLNEKLDRTAAAIRQEMRSGFSETQAMIKFSANQRALEDGLADLQARVERLESSTQ